VLNAESLRACTPALGRTISLNGIVSAELSLQMRKLLNRFLYLPPPEIFVWNAILFGGIFALVVYGSFSQNIGSVTDPFGKTDTSFSTTTLILTLGLLVAFATIYSRTRKFFICRRQCWHAALGTTLVVTLFYGALWTLIQLAKGTQQFVLLHPHSWNLQGTLNNLKYGSLLFLFSAFSLAGSFLVVSETGYDFGPFLNKWRAWRTVVKKLENRTRLTVDEHTSLLMLSTEMSEALELMPSSGHMQPLSLASAQALRTPLKEFDSWYSQITSATYANFIGFDDPTHENVRRILRLC
jgi:hypothetical protein